MSKNSQAVSKKFAAYPRLNPLGVGKNISAADLIDQCFLAYNGGRLREAAQLLVEKMLPSPAGVRAPVSDMPMQPLFGSIFSTSNCAASRKRPPL